MLFMGMKNEGAFRKCSNLLWCIVGWYSTVSAPGRNLTGSVGFYSETPGSTAACVQMNYRKVGISEYFEDQWPCHGAVSCLG